MQLSGIYVPNIVLFKEDGLLNEEQLRELTATIPLGRGGSPEEIARVVMNTVDSEFINGETINVNGGGFMGN